MDLPERIPVIFLYCGSDSEDLIDFGEDDPEKGYMACSGSGYRDSEISFIYGSDRR